MVGSEERRSHAGFTNEQKLGRNRGLKTDLSSVFNVRKMIDAAVQ
jgi:hypothetical protein